MDTSVTIVQRILRIWRSFSAPLPREETPDYAAQMTTAWFAAMDPEPDPDYRPPHDYQIEVLQIQFDAFLDDLEKRGEDLRCPCGGKLKWAKGNTAVTCKRCRAYYREADLRAESVLVDTFNKAHERARTRKEAYDKEEKEKVRRKIEAGWAYNYASMATCTSHLGGFGNSETPPIVYDLDPTWVFYAWTGFCRSQGIRR